MICLGEYTKYGRILGCCELEDGRYYRVRRPNGSDCWIHEEALTK